MICSLLEQVEQVPLGLADPAPDRASSTERVCPLKWRSAWYRQMTPQRSVASTSHQ